MALLSQLPRAACRAEAMTRSDNQGEPNPRRPGAPDDETAPATGQDSGARFFNGLAPTDQQGPGRLPPGGTFPGHEDFFEPRHGGQEAGGHVVALREQGCQPQVAFRNLRSRETTSALWETR